MTITTTDDVECESCEGRLGEEHSDPPYYKVAFMYGTGPRLAMEWQCEDCVDEEESPFDRDGDEVYFTDMDGNRLAEVQEMKKAYLESHQTFLELIGWDDEESE